MSTGICDNARLGSIVSVLLALILPVTPATGQSPPGPVDDTTELFMCATGPDIDPTLTCEIHDRDGDGDVDLRDFAMTQREFARVTALTCAIDDDADDGTEADARLWYPNGYACTNRNRMGLFEKKPCDVGLRFHLPDVLRGESFEHARLVLPAADTGSVPGTAILRIVGVDQGAVAGFEELPPSCLPKTPGKRSVGTGTGLAQRRTREPVLAVAAVLAEHRCDHQ